MPEQSLFFKLIGFNNPLLVNKQGKQGPVTILYRIISAPLELNPFKTFEHIPVGLADITGMGKMLLAYAGSEIRVVSTMASFGLLHLTSLEDTVPLRIILTNDPE